MHQTNQKYAPVQGMPNTLLPRTPVHDRPRAKPGHSRNPTQVSFRTQAERNDCDAGGTRLAIRALRFMATAMIAAALGGCGKDYFPPSDSEGGWRKNTDTEFIESLGLDPFHVEGFGGHSLSIPSDSHIVGYKYHEHVGTLVVKDGWIVGEWYNREDGAEFRNYLASVGKTFAIAMFGIAVQDAVDGRIPYSLDLSDRLYDRRWLAEGHPLSDPRKVEITFDQVFRHVSGMCPEETPDGTKIERGRDQWSDYVSWVVGHDANWPQTADLYFPPGRVAEYRDRTREPGHEHAYSSVAFAHIGLLLRNIYDMPAHQLLWERLLEPIGFSGIDYHEPPDPPSVKWFSAGGLRMTTRDFARFAYFIMKGGRWKDRQLLPEGWLDELTSTPYYPNLRSNVDGYFGERYPRDLIRIFGSGGNLAFIVPSLDLLAVRTSRTNNTLARLVEKDLLNRLFLMVGR